MLMVGICLGGMIEMINQKFKDFVEEWVEGSAESHCEAWKDRYFTKTKEQIEADLYINHDDSGEIEFVKEHFPKATEEEIEFYLERFKQECLEHMGY